ncbi:lamin tail domain-containing protein [Streptomyces sp. NPDC006334]|uniref:lamin tail domain-containing protein n=1 Tax=Streptomyces sp. NPDC006334 TaxID=3156754 RepID=UPI00339DECF7
MTVSTVSARRLAAASLAAAALLGAAALPATAADRFPNRPPVEISDVQYDAPGHDRRANHSLNKEWVELKNNTRHVINLRGWTLTDEDGDRYTFRNYRLAPRATVRVHTGEGRDTLGDVFQDRNRHIWDNRSDTATLRDDQGRVIDRESWNERRHHGGYRHHGERHHDGYRHHGERHHGDRHHGRDRG